MEKLLSLCVQRDPTALKDLLRTLSEKEICSYLEKCFRKHPEELVRLLGAVLRGLTISEVRSSKCKEAAFLYGTKLLQKGELSTSLSSNILCVLLENCTLSPESAVNVCTYLIDSIKSGECGPGRWLELLPQVLSDVMQQPKVPYVEGHVTGVEYKSHVVNTICSSRWPPNLVISIATMFRDVSLSSDELKFVLNKVFQMLPNMKYDTMPPLVYQLLLLSIKEHRKFVLEGLIAFFSEEESKIKPLERGKEPECELELSQESTQRDDLHHCEGTVLLHILYAARSDRDLGNELVKLLKANKLVPEKILMQFTLALSLCVSSIEQFQASIFECLKAAVLNYYKEKLLKEKLYWVREVLGKDDKIDDLELLTASVSASGWDHVTRGLIEFGFLLLNAFGGKPCRKSSKDKTSTGMACSLGAAIIRNAFKVNNSVRHSILQEILLHIVPTNTNLTAHYLNLLNVTIKQSPQAYTECIQKVHNLLDFLIYLPTPMAVDTINALLPLFHTNSSLRDSLLLILRKAMFSCQLDNRKTAVSGFLSCLKHFRIMGTLQSSQGSQPSSTMGSHMVDVHIPMKSSANEALCLELLGLLRRALTQQSDVRIILYNGFPEIISTSPYLIDCVLDVLLAQANVYFEPGSVPPIKLKQGTLVHGSKADHLEPLPHLLRCIEKCTKIAKARHESSRNESLSEDIYDEKEEWMHPLVVLLQELTDAMIKAELEDFELDKLADYNPSASVGSKNFLLASLLLGVYESLMEYSYFHYGYSTQMVEKVLQLFISHNKLIGMLKEKSVTTKKEKKSTNSTGSKSDKATAVKRLANVFSHNFIVAVMKALLLDNIPDHQEALTELREHADFQLFILNVAVQSMIFIHENGAFENEMGTEEDMFQYCCSLGQLFFHQITDEGNEQSRQRSSDTTFNQKCLEGLSATVDAISERFNDKFSMFLDSIVDKRLQSGLKENPGETASSSLIILKKIQQLLVKALSPTDKSVKYKEVGHLIHTASILTSNLSYTSQQFNDFNQCIQNICTENTFDDVIACKSVLSLLLKMNFQTSAFFPTLKKLAQDCHKHLGSANDDDDESVAQEATSVYSIISGQTAATAVSLILQQSEQFLGSIEWVMHRLKAKFSLTDEKTNSANARIASEKSICSYLATFATCLHELLVTAIPLGPIIDSVVHVTTRQYLMLSEYTKYFLQIIGMPNGGLCSRFENLIRLINTHLTPQVYAFINSVQQAAQNDQSNNNKKKKTGSDLSRVSRETRSMPQLIFSIEQFEKYIIQLSKKSKINLTANMKLNTNRDFRIDMAAVQAALAKEQSAAEMEDEDNENETTNPQDENSGSDDDDDNENGAESQNHPPPSKKKKLAPRDDVTSSVGGNSSLDVNTVLQEVLKMALIHKGLSCGLHVWKGSILDLVDIYFNEELFFQVSYPEEIKYTFRAIRATSFGSKFSEVLRDVSLVPAEPLHCCSPPSNSNALKDGVALVMRGECSFLSKAIQAEQAGAVAVLVMDSDFRNDDELILMDEDLTHRPVNIPAMFLTGKDGYMILKTLQKLELDRAIISIPVNVSGIPIHRQNQPPWNLW